MNGSVELEAAQWASGLLWEDVPAPVRERVELIFLDAVASGVAGATQALVADVAPASQVFAGTTAAARTFLHAYAITSATVCDVYRPGLCHVTPVVLPPLLAVAQDRRGNGADLLAALTVGLELTTRLCRALDCPTLRERGWHSPGVVGPVGAAAACARLMRHDSARTSHAMAHGAAQAAGTFAALGTEAVKFNQARGAVSAFLAAAMADAGMAAAPRWLTAEDGGMQVSYSAGAGDPQALVDELGSHWELMEISLRRWPAASSVQSLIETCVELHSQRDDVQDVTVELAPRAYEVSGDRDWSTPLAAQQSARWVTSAVLHDGTWWLEHSGARRGDSTLASFAKAHVSVTASGKVPSAGVRVTAVLRDGSKMTFAREDALGDPERPLTRAQIEEKADAAANSAGTTGGVVIAAVQTAADDGNVDEVARLLDVAA